MDRCIFGRAISKVSESEDPADFATPTASKPSALPLSLR